MKELELDRRDEEVLEAIVRSYIQTGEPVGSRTISLRSREGLSAATIRNVMADLEDKTLLTQPHTSAGRVPTDLAYRVYVDSLMKAQRLPPTEERLIESSLGESHSEVSELFASVSRVLSRLSRHMGVVVTPHIARVRLRDLEFVRMAPHRVLVVMVGASGVIYNKMVEIPEDHDQEKLDAIGRRLTKEFRGHTMPEVRDIILERMSEEKASFGALLRDALSVARAGLEIVPEEAGRLGEVFVDGTANLLSEPEFSSADRLQSLVRTIEEKHELLRLLNGCLEQHPTGVRVMIGSEVHSPDMSDCTLIAAAYGTEGQTLGALGIIGPTRMEYAHAIALVESVARLFSQALRRYEG